jgi:fatty acid desaturase
MVLALTLFREESMTHNYSSGQQHRHAFLSLFLTLLALGFGLLVLIFISGGFFLWVVLFAGGIFLFGMFHYILWGRAFSDETAGEREEEQLRQRAETEAEEQWHPPETRFRR